MQCALGVVLAGFAVAGGVGAGRLLAQVERAALVGVVVDGAGAPVPDAKVEVFECLGRGFSCFDSALRAEWTPVVSSPVDKAGRFGLQVPAGASLRVQVRHARFGLWRVDEHVLCKELRIELRPACTFRGRLVSAKTGEGVEGELQGYWGAVTRSFAGRTQIFRGRTDARGNFEFRQLPPGPFTCLIEPATHEAPNWWKGELRAEAACEQMFELQSGVAVRGRVLDAATRQPIAGASIGEGWFLGRPVSTGADGGFVLAGLGTGNTEIACVAAGYVRQLFEREAATTDGAHDFVLERGSKVVGTVVDARGQPVAGVYVAAAAFGRALTWLPQRTAADGTFACDGLPASDGYLVLRCAGHAFAVYHLPPPGGERRIEVGKLALQPGQLVRATVHDAAGKPLAGARMRLFGINADMERLTGARLLGFGDGRQLADRFTYSDADGNVCFGAVAAGKYQLGFDAEPMPMVPDDAIEVVVDDKGAPPGLIVARSK